MYICYVNLFLFNYTATTEIYTYLHTLSLHDALPISSASRTLSVYWACAGLADISAAASIRDSLKRMLPYCLERKMARSEEHTSELQSLMRISYAVFCLKKQKTITHSSVT